MQLHAINVILAYYDFSSSLTSLFFNNNNLLIQEKLLESWNNSFILCMEEEPVISILSELVDLPFKDIDKKFHRGDPD